jgi:hypothetical protein
MRWNKHSRRKTGGQWRCVVLERERVRNRRATDPEWAERERARDHRRRSDPIYREKERAQLRARYDSDPIFRLGKNLHDAARKRQATLERNRQKLKEG